MAKSGYVWSANKMACVATYRVLEAYQYMNEFEARTISFEDAPEVKLSTLRYWPRSSANTAALDFAASEAAKQFWYLVASNYTVLKEDFTANSDALLDKVEAVFRSDKATIKDLAEVLDAGLKFPNE